MGKETLKKEMDFYDVTRVILGFPKISFNVFSFDAVLLSRETWSHQFPNDERMR